MPRIRTEAGAEAIGIQADLSTAVAMERLFADTVAAIDRPGIASNTVNAKPAFFFMKEAGKHLKDNGKICALVTSLLGAFRSGPDGHAALRSRGRA